MKDLDGNTLPVSIPENIHCDVVRKAMSGDNKYEPLLHWLASGRSIDAIQNHILHLEGKPLAFPDASVVDRYGQPLPLCIPKKVYNEVLKSLESGNLYTPYAHWIASGRYIDQLHAKIAQVEAAKQSDRVIRKFLWKPAGEGGAPQYHGKVVILTDLEGVVAIANGENLKDHGPSNGYGTTTRSLKRCDEFSSPVKVTFFEKDGRQISTKNGLVVTVENPCNRFSF